MHTKFCIRNPTALATTPAGSCIATAPTMQPMVWLLSSREELANLLGNWIPNKVRDLTVSTVYSSVHSYTYIILYISWHLHVLFDVVCLCEYMHICVCKWNPTLLVVGQKSWVLRVACVLKHSLRCLNTYVESVTATLSKDATSCAEAVPLPKGDVAFPNAQPNGSPPLLMATAGTLWADFSEVIIGTDLGLSGGDKSSNGGEFHFCFKFIYIFLLSIEP